MAWIRNFTLVAKRYRAARKARTKRILTGTNSLGVRYAYMMRPPSYRCVKEVIVIRLFLAACEINPISPLPIT
jgi:hypothetical protein